jgi:hypothetical protein
MLRPSLYTIAAAGALALAACNPFRSPLSHEPVVQVTTNDANRNSRWHGQLTTPSNLAGAVQMTGQIAMTPDKDPNKTNVSIVLSNASPGGRHPWQLHRGQCGMDEGVFGSASDYNTLGVDDKGRAAGSATVGIPMPRTGDYYVSVGASEANPTTIVACGNLAAPIE